MTDYGLPFVEVHQGCPHLETKWVRCHDCERKRCLRCGGLLPTRLGVRHTAGKRRKLARERERAFNNAVARLIEPTQGAAKALTELRIATAALSSVFRRKDHAAPPV